MRDLETIKLKSNETFSYFLLRWRKKSIKIMNRPIKKDRVRLVVKNLLLAYYEKLYNLPVATFE